MTRLNFFTPNYLCADLFDGGGRHNFRVAADAACVETDRAVLVCMGGGRGSHLSNAPGCQVVVFVKISPGVCASPSKLTSQRTPMLSCPSG